MGYYLPIPCAKGKAELAIEMYDAREVPQSEASKSIDDPTLAVIVVINNGPFEAAGFAFDRDEFIVFSLPQDHRPKRWFVMDRVKACEATGYRGKE